MRLKRVSLSKIIFICAIIFSIIPDIGIKFSVAGFTWTIYRIVVMLCVVIVFFGMKHLSIIKNSMLTKWMFFLAVWILYGLVLLFSSKYSNLHNGFVELLSIICGLVVVYYLSLFLKDAENRNKAIRILYWLLNLMLIIGAVEIITGKHWIGSAYYDNASSIFLYSNTHQATGFMYNMNDFSAMITCMTPVLLEKRLGKKRLITLAAVLIVNLINDATACTFAIVIFVAFYFLIIIGGRSSKRFIYRLVFWTLLVAILIFVATSGAELVNRNDFLGAVARQVVNAQRSTGSLYVRLVMYKDAFRAWLLTGMMGMGPAGYSNYFSVHQSVSGLVNPHSLILEILSQYGIIIAGCFIILLAEMYRKAKKMYNSTDETAKKNGLMVIAFVIIYFFASFAPSSFIGYSYQWMMIAVMCSLIDNYVFDETIGGIAYA